MRYLRIVTILIFVAACGLLGWTIYQVSLMDTVAPQIVDSVGELHLQVSAEDGALLQGLTALHRMHTHPSSVTPIGERRSASSPECMDLGPLPIVWNKFRRGF